MLLEKIKSDMWTAKKGGESEKVKAVLLNTLYAEASMVGKNDGNRLTTDVEVIATIKKFLKSMDEMLTVVHDVETKNAVLYEIGVLNSYMPKQLTEDELFNVLVNFRNRRLTEGANKPGMSEYMSYLKSDHAGLYDGSMASKIAKTL